MHLRMCQDENHLLRAKAGLVSSADSPAAKSGGGKKKSASKGSDVIGARAAAPVAQTVSLEIDRLSFEA